MNNINAVKMVRNIRDKQYEEIKGKTHEEIIRFFKKNSAWAFSKKVYKQLHKV